MVQCFQKENGRSIDGMDSIYGSSDIGTLLARFCLSDLYFWDFSSPLSLKNEFDSNDLNEMFHTSCHSLSLQICASDFPFSCQNNVISPPAHLSISLISFFVIIKSFGNI